MIIKSLNIISFGKLKNKSISFGDKLNIVYGTNESGKTTVSAFIEAMLYSFPPRSDRSRYLPWDNSTAAGEMTIEHEGKVMTFYRKFAPTPKGDVIEPKDFSLSGIIPPDRESYRKSIYSPEGKSGSFGTTDYINSCIAATLTSSNENLSISQAVKYLEKLRRSLNHGNKLKSYENRVSALEDEYTLSFANTEKVAANSAAISEKTKLLKHYEKLAELSEARNISSVDEISQIDAAIKKQDDYIKLFPASEGTLPQKPSFGSVNLIFYIICTILMFFALYFIKPVFSFAALLPFFVYCLRFIYSMHKFRANLASFLESSLCSNADEYLKMKSELEAAKAHRDVLVAEKSRLMSEHSLKEASEKNELYKKILSLKNEIEALKEASYIPCREISIIKEELLHYKALHTELQKKLNAIRAAISAFNHAQEVISTDFTPKVTKKAMEYLNMIAPKEGRSVSLSKDMSLVVKDPVLADFSAFSFGFREEVQIAFRLAWSEFLYGDKFPLVLDDPFLASDDFRSKNLLNLLSQIAQNRQVIIFTNRKNSCFSQLNCKFIDISPSFDV